MARDLGRRLEQMLERDFAEGTLVRNDRGTINRTVYAVRLGTTQSSISVLKEILAPFDQFGPQVADAAARLQAVLEDDLARGALVRNDEGNINRTVYAQRIGVERSYLSALRHVIQPFDELGPDIVPTKDRLRAILEADLAVGKVVLSRVNSINERHYMEMVGTTNRRPYAGLFAEIEGRLGLGASLSIQLQRLLEADFNGGGPTIGRAGRISRLHYAEKLGVHKAKLTPHIRLLQYYESPSGRKRWRSIAAVCRLRLETGLQNSPVSMDVETSRAILAEFDRKCEDIDHSHTHLKLFLTGVELGDDDAFALCRDLLNLDTSSDPVQLDAENDNSQGPHTCQTSVVEDGAPEEVGGVACEVQDDLDLCRTTIGRCLPTEAVGSIPHQEAPHIASEQLPLQSDDESPEMAGHSASVATHFADFIARNPELEKHQYYPQGSTRAVLVEMLNSYIVDTGDIARSRGGKVDRRRLSLALGFGKSAIQNYMDIVGDYERALGNLMSVHEARVGEMRLWFTAKMADGTLEVRDGRVERKQFWDHFQLGGSGNALERYPAIGKLVAEVDQEIEETGYLPRRLSDRVSTLREYLRGGCSLNKDRLHYNQTDAARAIGCPIGDLRRPPLWTILVEEEKAHLQRLEADPLTALVGKRVNPFHELVALGLAESYVVRIAASFERLYRNAQKARVKDHYLALVRLFRFVATGAATCCGSELHPISTGQSA